MKIKACNKIYEGSPQEIVGQLRELLLNPDEAPDTESYVEHIKSIYLLIIGEEMLLEGNLDQQIEDMFHYLEYIGIMEILEDQDE